MEELEHKHSEQLAELDQKHFEFLECVKRSQASIDANRILFTEAADAKRRELKSVADRVNNTASESNFDMLLDAAKSTHGKRETF